MPSTHSSARLGQASMYHGVCSWTQSPRWWTKLGLELTASSSTRSSSSVARKMPPTTLLEATTPVCAQSIPIDHHNLLLWNEIYHLNAIRLGCQTAENFVKEIKHAFFPPLESVDLISTLDCNKSRPSKIDHNLLLFNKCHHLNIMLLVKPHINSCEGDQTCTFHSLNRWISFRH